MRLKEMETQLLAKGKFADWADHMMDDFKEGVIAVDQNGMIFYANDAYRRILGVKPERIIGKKIQEIEPDSALAKVLTERKTVHISKQLIRSLDKYVTIHVEPVFAGDAFLGAYSIFRDKTTTVNLRSQIRETEAQNTNLNEELSRVLAMNEKDVIGNSPAFRNLLEKALIVARTDAPVLIRGESGTGKEVIAKFIHTNSLRKARAPILVNCAAIPPNLIESELFGYEEGSFTGSKRGGMKGKFEVADGSTIFLDEIGELPLTVQPKLLRVLQEGEIEKIGRAKSIPVDVRILAATNQPLEEMIERKKFRRDLYYRLNVIELMIPPLRERGEDILLLAEFFLAKNCARYRKEAKLTSELVDFFFHYNWPGNVRELQNCIEHAVILCQDGHLTPDLISPHMHRAYEAFCRHDDSATAAASGMLHDEPARKKEESGGLPLSTKWSGEPLSEATARFEAAVIRDAIQKCGGNRTKAIEALGLSRRTFYRKLKEYQI